MAYGARRALFGSLRKTESSLVDHNACVIPTRKISLGNVIIVS
jgi:hypothetical protein